MLKRCFYARILHCNKDRGKQEDTRFSALGLPHDYGKQYKQVLCGQEKSEHVACVISKNKSLTDVTKILTLRLLCVHYLNRELNRVSMKKQLKVVFENTNAEQNYH